MLTVKQINEFLVAKNIGLRCPLCRSDSFGINGGGAQEPSEAAVFELIAPIENGVHSFFSISCANCGHSYFFHTRTIDAWLKSVDKK